MTATIEQVADTFREHLQGYGYAQAFAEGVAWYPDAWRECRRLARSYRVSPQRAAAIVAILSPRAKWSRNLRAAETLLADADAIRQGKRKRYRARYGVLPRQVLTARKAIDAAAYSDVVSGPKVIPFYRNIRGDVDIVTVDTIMAKAAGLGANVTVSVRETVTAAVYLLAREYGLTPRDMQAAVWIAYRGRPD
jgi:hypothetical protein